MEDLIRKVLALEEDVDVVAFIIQQSIELETSYTIIKRLEDEVYFLRDVIRCNK